MNKKILLFVILGIIVVGSAIFFQQSQWGTEVLWRISDQGSWLLPLISVSALVDSINPCAFSILLLTIAFLISLGRLRSNIMKIGLTYVFGLFVVYIGIGLGLLQVLHLFDTPHFMAKIGATLLIVLGIINLLNVLFPQFPLKIRIPEAAHRKMAELMDKGSLPAAFILGALVGLCEFPCTGGPYLMVLGLLHDRQTYYGGLGYLLLYNLIFVLPLIIILFIASNKQFIEKVQAWQDKEKRAMRLFGGIAMIALGVLIFFL